MPRRHLQRHRQKPAPPGRHREEVGFGRTCMRVLPRPRPKTRRHGGCHPNPQPGEAHRRSHRSHLPHVPPESANAHWALAKQPRQRRGRLHYLPRDSCERWRQVGSSAGRSQRAVLGLPSQVWAQFQQPNHHKLPEGSMTCLDYHNPHGTSRSFMVRTFAANEPACFTCHGDKRGPFTFEHAAVRFEGCATCHEPHGSANARMLTRQSVQYVCLECHANLPTVNRTATIGVVPPAFHDLRLPVFQNCTVCHQKIHGSHVDRNLLK